MEYTEGMCRGKFIIVNAAIRKERPQINDLTLHLTELKRTRAN